MTDIKPFTFQSFGSVPARRPAGFSPFITEELPEHERKIYTSQDLAKHEQAGREKGYKEGVEAGIAQGKSEELALNQKLAAMLATLDKKFEAAYQHFTVTLAASAQDTARLSLTIARKVAEDALDANGAARIEGLVRRCMDLLFQKSEVTLAVHPEVLDALKVRFDAMAERHGFQGKILYQADAALAPHDCRIAWEGGGARLDTPGTWAAIEMIVQENGLEAPKQEQVSGTGSS